VKATREGLVGQTTASGYVIDRVVRFVALPSTKAIHDPRSVRVTSCLTGRSCLAQVLDVGPHHTDDDGYVYGDRRPRAESDPHSNRAGIDLSEAVHQALGMTEDNGEVMWEWV